MGQGIDFKALAYILVVLIGVGFVMPRFSKDTLPYRILGYWIGAALIIFSLTIPPVRLILLAVLAIALTPAKLSERPGFFAGVLFAVPPGIAYRVPFPGVNYLIEIDHNLLLAILVALPMLVAAGRQAVEDRRPPVRFPDVLMVTIVVLFVILQGRLNAMTPTHFLRTAITDGCLILLPYFALTRTLTNEAAFRSLVSGLLTAASITVAIGFLNWFHNWNHYSVAIDDQIFAAAAYRGGGVRVQVTTVATLAGFFMFASAYMFWTLRKNLAYPTAAIFVWIAVSLFVLVQTDSRGALVGAAVFAAALFFMRLQSTGGRAALIALGVIAAGIGWFSIQQQGLGSLDQYGTFTYREQLLETGLEHLRENLLLGDANYATDPRFAGLRQGQGIIDFVNSYLQIGLAGGIVGLTLYAVLFLWVGISLVRSTDRIVQQGGKGSLLHGTGMGLAAALGSLVIIMFTISLVANIPQTMFLLIACGVAFVRLSHVWQAVPQAEVRATPKAAPEFVIDARPGLKGWTS
jgi:O-antigen ligase